MALDRGGSFGNDGEFGGGEMTDYIKIRVDGGHEVAISWEQVEGGLPFDELMQKLEVAVVAAGWSQELFDKYMRSE